MIFQFCGFILYDKPFISQVVTVMGHVTALLNTSGGIISAFVNSMVLDRVGPRPMLILYSFILLIISLLWVFAPGSLPKGSHLLWRWYIIFQKRLIQRLCL